MTDTKPGLVELTPDLMQQISDTISERRADIAARFPALVGDCPYETRLAVAAWVIEKIVEAGRDEYCSFRGLIYDLLDFGPDAYLPLYQAGGMVITNEFLVTESLPEDASRADALMKALWPKKGVETPKMQGGTEPWLSVCWVVNRVKELSAALAAEQEKRRRVERELADLHAKGAFIAPEQGALFGNGGQA
jgi:hypothetical protein